MGPARAAPQGPPRQDGRRIDRKACALAECQIRSGLRSALDRGVVLRGVLEPGHPRQAPVPGQGLVPSRIRLQIWSP